MAVIETWFKQDLKSMVAVHPLPGNVFTADNDGNLIGIEVFDDGAPADLAGTVSANVIRPDGGTVSVGGTLADGNRCSVILPQAAYAYPGPVAVIIKLTSGTTVTTIGAAVGTCTRSTTGVVVDPGTIIPSVQNLIDEIEAAIADVPASATNLRAALAETYSTSGKYAVGSYAWQEGVLYKCSTAITSGESWTPGHWTTAKVANDVSDLKSAVSGYNQLYYLESSGSQFITLGFKATQNTRVVCRFQIPESYQIGSDVNYIIGNGGSVRLAFTSSSNGKFMAYYGAGSSYVIQPADYNIHEIEINKNKVYFDGTLVKEFDPEEYTASYNFYLFGNRNSSTAYGYGDVRIFSFQVYENDVLFMDVIPVERKSDGKTGAFDKKNLVFYPVNQENNLILGDMITLEASYDLAKKSYDSDPYEPVEYIESHGTEYIDTGILLNNNSRVVCDFSMEDYTSRQYIFGGRYTSSSNAFAFTAYTGTWCGVGYYSTYDAYLPIDLHTVHRIDLNKNVATLDGTVINTAEERTFTAGNTMMLFGIKATTSNMVGHSRIYRCTVYNNGVLLADFVPVRRKSDGVLGMYDTVGVRFLTNSGTGEFTTPSMNAIENIANAAVDDRPVRNYIATEADRVSEKVRSVQTGNSLTFIACSDLHYAVFTESTDDVTVKKSQEALRDMRDAIKAIANQTHIDFYSCFGDVIYQWQGHGASYDNGVKEIIGVTKLLNSAFGSNPQIRLVGNHDPNCENSDNKEFTAYQMNSFSGIYSNMLTLDESQPYGGYGYHDFERQKVRLIVLNTSFYTPSDNIDNGATRYYVGNKQAYWLCQKLDLSEKSDAANWKIVICSHVRLDRTTTVEIYRFTNVLDRYINGTKWTGGSYEYDFEGKNAAKIAMYLNGHEHAYLFKNMLYYTFVESGTPPHLESILPLANFQIPNALPGRDYESTDGVTYTKTEGTAESTAFEVITFDFANKIMYANHYGAGIDIVMHYDPTTTGTFETSLTSPTWASVDTAIATVSGGVVTPVSAGYVMIYAKSETDNCIEVWNYHSVV